MIGLSSGTYQCLIPIAIKECVGEKDMPVAFGWDYFAMGIGFLCGPIFTGWIYGQTHNFDVAFYITGGVSMVSGLLIVLAPKIGSRKRKQNDEENISRNTLPNNHLEVIVDWTTSL
ncbi:monocarboxylate transporter 14-like [Glandiceps talaboti]